AIARPSPPPAPAAWRRSTPSASSKRSTAEGPPARRRCAGAGAPAPLRVLAPRAPRKLRRPPESARARGSCGSLRRRPRSRTARHADIPPTTGVRRPRAEPSPRYATAELARAPAGRGELQEEEAAHDHHEVEKHAGGGVAEDAER